MAVTSGGVDDLGDLGLGDVERENAADADSMLMDVKHDRDRILAGLVEESLEYVGYKFHRRVVVVQEQNAIERRFLRLRLGLGDHSDADVCFLITLLSLGHQNLSKARREPSTGGLDMEMRTIWKGARPFRDD
jgi:hypothetical protein